MVTNGADVCFIDYIVQSVDYWSSYFCLKDLIRIDNALTNAYEIEFAINVLRIICSTDQNAILFQSKCEAL